MSNLFVFTTGTNLDLLQQSAESVMITVHTYDVPHWKGYVSGKLREGVKFLSSKLLEYEFAMWVDGNDSLILKSEDEILSRLQAYGFPLLFSAEHTCWPEETLASNYPAAPTPRFLNAGGYIGPIGYVLTAMHTALQFAEGSEDDQLVWTRAYLAGALMGAQIDHARRIFASVGDGDAALKADSCIKHWNGRVSGREEYYTTWRSQKSIQHI